MRHVYVALLFLVTGCFGESVSFMEAGEAGETLASLLPDPATPPTITVEFQPETSNPPPGSNTDTSTDEDDGETDTTSNDEDTDDDGSETSGDSGETTTETTVADVNAVCNSHPTMLNNGHVLSVPISTITNLKITGNGVYALTLNSAATLCITVVGTAIVKLYLPAGKTIQTFFLRVGGNSTTALMGQGTIQSLTVDRRGNASLTINPFQANFL